MANSYSHILPVHPSSIAASSNSLVVPEKNAWPLVCLISVLALSFSLFFVPERPNQYASICQKYNSGSACQVW